mmetsp:Transcript_26138/g.73340  ORF Transcript_26138/g.73340 Transcript_26138/m.73340 type:complete len:387 (-) Transcript_26138:435-1595(-)
MSSSSRARIRSSDMALTAMPSLYVPRTARTRTPSTASTTSRTPPALDRFGARLSTNTSSAPFGVGTTSTGVVSRRALSPFFVHSVAHSRTQLRTSFSDARAGLLNNSGPSAFSNKSLQSTDASAPLTAIVAFATRASRQHRANAAAATSTEVASSSVSPTSTTALPDAPLASPRRTTTLSPPSPIFCRANLAAPSTPRAPSSAPLRNKNANSPDRVTPWRDATTTRRGLAVSTRRFASASPASTNTNVPVLPRLASPTDTSCTPSFLSSSTTNSCSAPPFAPHTRTAFDTGTLATGAGSASTSSSVTITSSSNSGKGPRGSTPASRAKASMRVSKALASAAISSSSSARLIFVTARSSSFIFSTVLLKSSLALSKVASRAARSTSR